MDYKATVTEASRELTAREKIKFKDLSDAIAMDSAVTEDEALIIEPTAYAIIDVHNEKSDNKDYRKYVIEAANGQLYCTGSESFWKSFKDIWDEMEGEDDDWSLKVYKKESANYKGKQFITCSIV